MNKIIQLLRLSRLVLLVILLLFAVVAKIARADSAVLYKGSYGTAECKAFSSPDPQAVFNVCFPGAESQGWKIHKDPVLPYHYNVGPHPDYAYQKIIGQLKTCDAKELTHNGVSNGALAPQNYFWQKSYSGTDAALWFPDRYESCENNCVVRNQRMPISIPPVVPDGVIYSQDGKSVTEKDGKSWSWFTKNQTGEVCVPESKKKNDPPNPPRPDTGDGADGNGQGGAGSDSGSNNGAGSQGGQGSGSQNGSDGQANQGSGNSNEGGTSSGGSGGGSGGVNGSGGQTGPSGGGTSGGESGGSQSGGSESEDNGEPGTGESGGTGSDSGGQGSGNGSGQGQVGGTEGGESGGDNGQSGGDGDGEAGGHYFPCPSGKGSYKKGTELSAECLGEGKGEGSIGGGSCDTDTPPECKGDPIQCYIAREQWRTACAASGKSNKIEGQGNCEQLTPPECKGDETQCYIAKQQFISACEAQAQHQARNSLKEYADGKSDIISDVESSSEDGVKQALEDNGGNIDLTNLINRSGYGWSRSCPASATIDAGIFGTFEIDNSMLCTMAQVLGKIFAALCMLFAVRYIFA